MNIEEFRDYCLSKKGSTEQFPFDESTLVFKVMGKMFALTSLDNPDFSVNLKCDPEKAINYRSKYSSIVAGYHMNKKHWNTIYLTHRDLDDVFVKEMIDHSYDLVVNNLTKKLKEELKHL